MFKPKSKQANITDSFKNSESEFPLHASICNNNLATLQQLLNCPEAAYLLSTGDGFWGAPLHVAIYCDSLEAVDLLLEAGANVAAKSSARDDRMSPLALAAYVGNRRLLWRLWKHAVCPRDHTESIQNVDSCLIEAAMSGQVPILGALLDWYGDGWTVEAKNQALCWAARRWKLYSVEFLLSKLSFDQQALDRALEGAVDFKFPLDSETYIDYEGVDYL
ncbi:hypothetical protein ACJ41O_003815 [Fusarium nematophilum]